MSMYGMAAASDPVWVKVAAAGSTAEAKAAADFLPLLGRGAVTVLERANLEDVRVVPALPQSGVGEYKPNRITERK